MVKDGNYDDDDDDDDDDNDDDDDDDYYYYYYYCYYYCHQYNSVQTMFYHFVSTITISLQQYFPLMLG